jgi:hypothetical protein
MEKNKRFKEIYTQGTLTRTVIFVDTETGVNYLFHQDGHSGGLTVLLDKDGKPVVTPVED